MLVSPAWRALTAQQQRLYMVCKAQYYADKQKFNIRRRCSLVLHNAAKPRLEMLWL